MADKAVRRWTVAQQWQRTSLRDTVSFVASATGFFPWTVDQSRGSQRHDPLNLYFAGSLAELHVASDAARTCLAVSPTRLANGQWFLEFLSGVTSSHRHDMSLGGERDLFARAARVHVRLYAGSSTGGPITAGAIHRDALSFCGDAAVSFDTAREWAGERFRAHGLKVARVRDKERGSVRQCDGSWTATDGFALVVRD